MMINWAEKQPEDQIKLLDMLDAMTQYGLRNQEKLCRSLRIEQEQQDNLELYSGDILREDGPAWTRPGGAGQKASWC